MRKSLDGLDGFFLFRLDLLSDGGPISHLTVRANKGWSLFHGCMSSLLPISPRVSFLILGRGLLSIGSVH